MLKFKNNGDKIEVFFFKEIVGIIYIKPLVFCPLNAGSYFNVKMLTAILHKLNSIRPNGMHRLRKLKLAEVLKHIGKSNWKVWANSKLHCVPMKNQRMLLLGRSQVCACCGLKATHFWLEYSGCKPPHLNMYGRRGQQEVMLTCDHIVPRSKGGKTTKNNVQLLCSCCNSAKKNDEITLEELRKRVGLQTTNLEYNEG